MRYGLIVEWIDGELGRLQAVRKLLETSSLIEISPAVQDARESAPKPHLGTGKRRGRPPGSKAKPKTTSPLEPKPSQAPAVRALAGTFPLHVVVVPAAEVQVRRPVGTTPRKPESQPVVDGTLESMLREVQARQTVAS